MSYDKNAVKEAVKKHYENLAQGSLSVHGEAEKITTSIGYAAQDLTGIPKEADLGLGCGNPQEAAKPRLNETILDLGCGRGLDCFIASKAVGKNRKVFGLDSSKTMINRASKIAVKNGFTNCEFIFDEIEGLFSAAKIARSSNNVHPCTLFDSEFWLKPKYRSCYNHRHPWRYECRVCKSKLSHCMPFLSFAYETAQCNNFQS